VKVDVHFPPDDTVLRYLRELLRRMMTMGQTMDELAAELAAVTAAVAKIGTETSATLQKVADLEAALAAGGMTSPEVDAALDALKAQVNLVDSLIPDSP
jgi:ABC-type transporter Mla subunit MlaD